MKNFEISADLMKKFDGIILELLTKYSEKELLIINDSDRKHNCNCGGGCAGSCAHNCGGCGNHCKGGCGGGFMI